MSRIGIIVVLASAEGADFGADGAERGTGVETRKLLMTANVANFILFSLLI